MAKGKKPKGKVIDSLPKPLKAALDKPRLKDITYADLNVIVGQLDKFFDEDPSGFRQRACGLCTKWGG